MARPIFNPAGLNRPKLAFSLSRAGFYPRRLRGAGKPEVGGAAMPVSPVARRRPPGRRWWCGGQFGALLCQYRPVVVVQRPVPLTAAPAPASSGGARVSLKLGALLYRVAGRRVAGWWCGRPVPLTAPAPAPAIAAQSGGPGPGGLACTTTTAAAAAPASSGGAGKPEVGGAALPGRPVVVVRAAFQHIRGMCAI